MTRTIRRQLATAALLLAGIPAAASAQLQFVGYGSGEWDTEEMAVYVLGLAAQTTNLGFGPTFNILAYQVDLPGSDNVRAINPSAGVQYRWAQTALQLRAGYAFLDAPDGLTNVGGEVFGGGEDGLTTTAQLIHWGTGERTAEIIGNMNWGDEYFWARGRADQRIMRTGSGGLNLGAEVVAQGNDVSQVFQVGPTAALTLGRLKLIGVVGYKFQEVIDDGPYFKAEFVFVR